MRLFGYKLYCFFQRVLSLLCQSSHLTLTNVFVDDATINQAGLALSVKGSGLDRERSQRKASYTIEKMLQTIFGDRIKSA